MRVFVDTNVLVYALTKSERGPACRELLMAIAAGDIAGTTSTLVIEELWHLSTRPAMQLPPTTAADAFEIFPEVLPVDEWAMQSALALVESPSVGTADLLHAAVCRSHRIDVIVSADAAFDQLAWIERVDATGHALEALLRRA